MDTDCANQSNKENIDKLAEYINSKSNPFEFASTLLSLCKPCRDHFSGRDQKSQIGV